MELKRGETVAEPELLPAEVPDSVLAVKEKEVAVVKYVSPEEKAKKAAEAKAYYCYIIILYKFCTSRLLFSGRC